MKCLRCNVELQYIGKEKIQLGQTGWFLGDFSNLLAGALEVEICICPECGKVEFFRPKESLEESSLPQKKCPRCGKNHDFDYPKCPYCKHNYFEE